MAPVQIIGFIIAIGSVLYAAWDTVSQDKAFMSRDIERLEVEDAGDYLKHSPVRSWSFAIVKLWSVVQLQTLCCAPSVVCSQMEVNAYG